MPLYIHFFRSRVNRGKGSFSIPTKKLSFFCRFSPSRSPGSAGQRRRSPVSAACYRVFPRLTFPLFSACFLLQCSVAYRSSLCHLFVYTHPMHSGAPLLLSLHLPHGKLVSKCSLFTSESQGLAKAGRIFGEERTMEHFKAELIDYLYYYNNRRIKLKLKGLTPAQHRYQTLRVA